MKGKYSARAANRREAESAEAAEVVYRRNIVKLTEERDAARKELETVRAEWQREARILRAQVAEGTSARVEALTFEIERIRSDRDRLTRHIKVQTDKWDATLARLREHFEVEHKATPYQARDMVLQLIVGGEGVFVDAGSIEHKQGKEFGTDRVRALRAARRQARRTAGPQS
jgi:hypothetical protein